MVNKSHDQDVVYLENKISKIYIFSSDSQRSRNIPGICNEKHFKLSQNLMKIVHMQKVGLINF